MLGHVKHSALPYLQPSPPLTAGRLCGRWTCCRHRTKARSSGENASKLPDKKPPGDEIDTSISVVELVKKSWKEAWEEDVPERNLDAEFQSLSQQAQQLQKQLGERLQQIWQRKPTAPQGDAATSGASTSDTATDATQSEPEQPVPMRQWPLLTWAMLACTWTLFVLQWVPFIPSLFASITDWSDALLRAAAVCLVVPEAPVSAAWQFDALRSMDEGVLGVIGGCVRAAFLHSGLLPTLLFTSGLSEVGMLLEQSWGPLVLMAHVTTCALFTGVAQLIAVPWVPVTITGPAMVCGMYVALAVHLVQAARGLDSEAELSQAAADVKLTNESDRNNSSRPVTGSRDDAETSEAAAATAGGQAPAAEAAAVASVLGALGLVPARAVACWVGALSLGLYLPALSIWGVLGGCLGGALAPFTSPLLVRGLLMVVRCIASAALYAVLLVRTLPRLLLTWGTGAVMVVVAGMREFIQALRKL